MRMHQPGSHLTQARGAQVDDWSWGRTARRIGMLVALTKPYRGRTWLSIAALLAAVLTTLAPPYLAKVAIDRGIRQEDLQLLGWIVAAFLGAGVLNWAASMAQTYYTGWVGERILADLRRQLFRHLQRLSLGFYERNRAGAVISRLTNDVEALDQLVTDGVTSLFQNSLTLVGSALILFFLDWRLALATLAVFPLMSVATAIFRRRSSRAYRRVRERLGLVTAALQEDISGMRVLQSFNREERNAAQFREVNDRYRAANQETVVLNGLYFPFVDFLSSAATSVVLGFGGYLVFDGSMTIGTLFAFIGYLANFFDPVQQLSQLYNTFLAAVAALEGPLTIDGQDLRDVPQERLRRQLGIVPQEGFLFAGSVRENIAFGRPAANDEEVAAAARAVGAHEFVLELENGYETDVAERGSRLSLGQRQLVAFARALLADPRILILDEATSSVDIGTERRIEEALRRLLAGRTAFVIAHRLSTIRGAELIVVLEHGRVVEQGSHGELMAR